MSKVFLCLGLALIFTAALLLAAGLSDPQWFETGYKMDVATIIGGMLLVGCGWMFRPRQKRLTQ